MTLQTAYKNYYVKDNVYRNLMKGGCFMQILNKLFPLISFIEKDAKLILLKIAELYAYENGVKTENLLGYKYTVVEDKQFEKIVIKIEDVLPIITQDELEKRTGQTYVKFKNCFGKLYKKADGNIDVSFSAESIELEK